MEVETILNRLINYLIDNNIIRNQQQFVEMVNSDKSTISLVKKGKIGISNKLFDNILAAFPQVSPAWLKTGEGEMLNSEINQSVDGNNNTSVAGNANLVNSSSTLDKAIEEISAQRKLTEKAMEQIDKHLEQIDRLISMLEKQ